jgi:PPP family 3-phenylpropionic acid transporter
MAPAGATNGGRDPGIAARDYALRVAAFYAAVFLIYGFHVPYLPLWLSWRALTDTEVAIVTAAPFFLRLAVTPVVAIAADRGGNHATFIFWLAVTGFVATLVLSQMTSFLPILVVSLVFALTTMTIMPLTETVAIAGVRAHALDYGRMRLWGSLTFIAIGLAGGAVVTAAGPSVVLPVLIAASAATVLAALMLPKPPASETTHTPGVQFSWQDVRRLLRAPLFLTFLFASGAVQAAHAMFYTFGALHWASQGISTTWVGALWAVAVLAEVLLFAYSAAVLRIASPTKLLLAGAAAAVVRWGVMSFDPPLALLFPLQLLHALTYGATHLAAIHFIHRAVPQSAAGTGQALYATVAAGFMMGAATLACGPLYAAISGRGYLATAALAALGLVAAYLVHRQWSGGELWSAAETKAKAAKPQPQSAG